MPIQLGDRVRDRISGFEGIVIGISDWLYGCRRPVVQPSTLTRDGEPVESKSFDEPQLEVIESGVLKADTAPAQPAAKTGGPRPTPARRSDPIR